MPISKEDKRKIVEAKDGEIVCCDGQVIANTPYAGPINLEDFTCPIEETVKPDAVVERRSEGL